MTSKPRDTEPQSSWDDGDDSTDVRFLDQHDPHTRPRSRRYNINGVAEEELLRASFVGDAKSAERLLFDGANPEAISTSPGQEGLRPLHLASWSGRDQIVKLLLHYNAKKNSTAKGLKAVHYASKGGHVNVLSVLWSAECNIKSRTVDGRSPLHLAADNGNMEAVKWLAEKGSYLYTKDAHGMIPEDLAKRSGYKDIARYLHEKNEEMRLDNLKGSKKKIGEGAFGEVYLVETDQSFIVLKRINLASLQRKTQEYAMQEIKLLKSLDHPYIVSYLGGGFKGRHLYIQMEFCSGGDLYDRIQDQKSKGVPFEERQVVSWCTKLLLALKHVHSRNVLHRDLKPHNIFLTWNGIIKLGDFGLAKALEEKTAASTALGSPAYAVLTNRTKRLDKMRKYYGPQNKQKISPEVMHGERYNSSADMWSFGCVMYEIAAMKPAFPYKDLKLPTNFSQEFANAAQSVFKNDPTIRPTAAELLKLDIFHDSLENQLEEKERQVTDLNHELDEFTYKTEELTLELQKREEIIKKLNENIIIKNLKKQQLK